MLPGSTTDISLVKAAHCYAIFTSNAVVHNLSDERKEEIYENFLNSIMLKQRKIADSVEFIQIDPFFRVIFSLIKTQNDQE
jgi:hypothetical protein